jgi:hypothetical protein
MCQNSKNSQVFATCHDNAIIVWSWNGTDIQGSTTKRALVVDSCIIRDVKEVMYGMCFLSRVPDAIAAQGGHVLMTLTGRTNQPWLTIRVITVFQPDNFCVNFQMDIGQDGAFLDAAQSGKLIFQTSHSEKILVVTGPGIVHFYEIRSAPQFSVDLVIDMTEEFPANEYGSGATIASCLCMPAPSGTGVSGALDWIVLGDSGGDLFGFLWRWNETTKKVERSPKHYGRFSSKQASHDRGIPVSLLVPTYGAASNAHHKAITDKESSYWQYLQEQLTCEKDRFLSLGDNGKVLHWSLETKKGWIAQEENWTSRCLENGRPSPARGCERQVLAAQSSRLVPNVLLLVDQRKKCISCVDTSGRPAAAIGGC